VAARGFDRIREIRGRGFLNPAQTTGGHGGPPLQYVPQGVVGIIQDVPQGLLGIFCAHERFAD